MNEIIDNTANCPKCAVDVETLIAPVFEPVLSTSQLLVDGQTTVSITNTGTSLDFNGGNIRFGSTATMTVAFDFPVNIRLSSTTALNTGLTASGTTNGTDWDYDNSNAGVIVSGQTFDIPTQIGSNAFGVITSDGVTELVLSGRAFESYFVEVMALQPHYLTTTECKSVCEILADHQAQIDLLGSSTQSNTRVIYSEEYFAKSTDGLTQSGNRGLTVARSSTGVWTATLATAHPDGVDYHPSIQVEEQDGAGNRDGIDPHIIQGSVSATGFKFMLTTGDNGTGADGYVDTPFTIGIDSPVTVLAP